MVIDLVHDTTPGLPELGNKSEDNNNARAYDEDALQVVFSSSKVFTSVAMALMVEKGWLKYSDRVVDIWPEFGETQVCSLLADIVLFCLLLTITTFHLCFFL